MDEFSRAENYLENGEGAKALPILEKLAEQGRLAAMHAIGHTYLYGVGGVKQDYDLAFKWFRRAAGNGCPQGMYHTGLCNARGYGTPVNPEEAALWFGKSADRGDEDAMFRFGDCCERGFGVPADREKALEWYKKAALRGQKEAAERVRAMREESAGGE